MSLVWPILAHLSAEPLVGLKLSILRRRVRLADAFSRTPRGFEAPLTNSFSLLGMRLSAEPLVGLKQGLHRLKREQPDFQPNPSWV